MDVCAIRKKRGLELKEFRIEKNLSIDTLSKLSGLHRATIYRIESGETWNIDSEIIYFETVRNYLSLSKTA